MGWVGWGGVGGQGKEQIMPAHARARPDKARHLLSALGRHRQYICARSHMEPHLGAHACVLARLCTLSRRCRVLIPRRRSPRACTRSGPPAVSEKRNVV